jgi:3-methyladenine DNA glycosylase AlkD
MNQRIFEIEKVLSCHPQRTSAHNPEAYIGGGQSKLRYLGLRVPMLRQSLRQGFSFSSDSQDEVARTWDYVWNNSDCFEVMALALAWFEDKKQRKALLTYWPFLQRWSARIDNWAHSDSLSGIYARILEQAPTLVYPTLQKWNKSKNPWLRRVSIVSLLYYSSQREKVLPFSKILSMVEPQIDYDHYYVQKGVGWTLRETGNVYPKETYAYLQKNIRRLSAPAFSAATEKLSVAQKNRLKILRKK